MNFAHRCTIPVARETLWQFLMDVPQVATCVPGVESVTPSGDDQYSGRMRVKVGPIHLTLQGVLTIQERDPQQWLAVARAEANDRRVGGGVHLTAHMTLVESGPATTELDVQTEARFLGKLGEFGQQVIRKQADAIITEFARNVAARFHNTAMAPQREEAQSELATAQSPEVSQPQSSTPSAPAKPVIGAVVGLGSALLLLATLPFPASPLLAGILTVGLTLLGAFTERGLRLRRTRRG